MHPFCARFHRFFAARIFYYNNEIFNEHFKMYLRTYVFIKLKMQSDCFISQFENHIVLWLLSRHRIVCTIIYSKIFIYKRISN